MEELKQRILKDGSARAEGGIVLVNSFLNHQLDPQLLTADDRILFIDDFLADGHASGSVIHLCRQSGAQIVGMGFLVEKGFAGGGQFLRDHNITYHALATVRHINEDNTMEVVS